MPNTYNYQTDTTTFVRANISKYLVSRVISNPLDTLLEVRVPSEIPEYFIIEMMIYSKYDNSLIRSYVIESTDENVLSTVTLNYTPSTTGAQPTLRKLLFINFAKLDFIFDEGKFNTVLNFFVPEIGTYNEGQFSVTRISPSRTELELNLLPKCTSEETLTELKNFASPQINDEWVLAAIAQVFNQPVASVLNSQKIPTDNSNLTFESIKSSLPVEQRTVLNDPNTPQNFKTLVESRTQTMLNRAYNYAVQSVNTLKTNGTVRFTNTTLKSIVSESIRRATIDYTQVPGVRFI
jgi:hypothetical protein